LNEGPSDQQIFWGGDFDVLGITWNQVNGMPGSFEYTGVIRKMIFVRDAVSSLQQLGLKTLWRLNSPQLGTHQCTFFHIPNAILHSNDWNGTTMQRSSVITRLDDLNGGERPDGIVHANDSRIRNG
jgi:hypothetical protein